MAWVVSARCGHRQVREFSEGEITLEREGLSANRLPGLRSSTGGSRFLALRALWLVFAEGFPSGFLSPGIVGNPNPRLLSFAEGSFGLFLSVFVKFGERTVRYPRCLAG